jgi:hypothetical protein
LGHATRTTSAACWSWASTLRASCKKPPCGRELHVLGVALHEHRAQILLQRLERHAQRRLGDAQALGGPAEVQLLGQDHKVTQQMGFHHVSQSLAKTIPHAARRWEFASVCWSSAGRSSKSLASFNISCGQPAATHISSQIDF